MTMSPLEGEMPLMPWEQEAQKFASTVRALTKNDLPVGQYVARIFTLSEEVADPVGIFQREYPELVGVQLPSPELIAEMVAAEYKQALQNQRDRVKIVIAGPADINSQIDLFHKKVQQLARERRATEAFASLHTVPVNSTTDALTLGIYGKKPKLPPMVSELICAYQFSAINPIRLTVH